MEGRKESDGDWTELARFDLEGTHGAETSINYSHPVDLGGFLQKGASVRATFTVVGGNVFQINGMAFCYSPQSIESA